MKKIIIPVVVCAVLAFAGIGLYRYLNKDSGGNAERGGNAAVAIEASDILVMPMREVSHFSGSLQARSRFILSTKVAGRLERIYVDVGDRVSRGQAVAVLDDREYVGQVKQAQADLDVAQANLRDAGNSRETARTELKRVTTLFENKIASQTEMDNAETAQRKAEIQYAVAEAQIRQKRAALDTVQERLDDTRLMAEWDAGSSGGNARVVGERFVDPGALLKANDPLVSIFDISSLTATINVTEAMYSRMRPGLRAQAETDAIPGRVFEGTVERIAPILNEMSRQAEIRIGIPNPSGELKPGMFVRVSIEYSRSDTALTVPVTALVKRNEREGVFLLSQDEKSVQFIPVVTGITGSGRTEIREPAHLSGKVVTLGHHLLQDGSEVFLP
jgi:RND family efflux transporter MFP subunit